MGLWESVHTCFYQVPFATFTYSGTSKSMRMWFMQDKCLRNISRLDSSVFCSRGFSHITWLTFDSDLDFDGDTLWRFVCSILFWFTLTYLKSINNHWSIHSIWTLIGFLNAFFLSEIPRMIPITQQQKKIQNIEAIYKQIEIKWVNDPSAIISPWYRTID